MRNPSFILLLVITLYATAQKLPNKQEVSVWAPVNIKIDGKIDEWGAMKAHNSATGLYYMLANDAENLYLVVQANEPRVIEKVLVVGINLTISQQGKKQKNDPQVSYPVINYNYVHGILVNAGTKANWSGRPKREGNPTEVLTRTDSSVMKANKAFAMQSTIIKAFNLKGIADTSISVNNSLKIKAAAMFDIKGVYTYEVAIPLKNLGTISSTAQSFTYSIVLKDFGNAMLSTYRDRQTGETRDADPDINSTTDFSADYTLAKAP